MANNYYGIPVHGQPAQYTAPATAYPAAPAFVGQTTQTSYARVQTAGQAPVAASTATSIVASANAAAAYPYPAAQYPATPSVPLAASTPYYPQPTLAGATGVTYSAADGSYQARPTYSHTPGARTQAIVTTRPLTSYVAPGTYTSAYASTPTTYS